MNQNPNDQNQNHPELDEQMEAAVWAVLSDPIPVDAVERVKQRARELKSVSRPASQTKKQRRHPAVLRLAIAASVLAMVLGGFSLLGVFSGSGSSSLYAQVAREIESLKSMVCHVQFSSTTSLSVLQNQQGGKEVTYLAPSFHRIEDQQLGTVKIIDGNLGQMIDLNLETKQAALYEGASAIVHEVMSPARLAETLLRHIRVDRLNHGVESLGTETQDGVTLQGYESTIDGEIVRAWFDVESLAPVMVAVSFTIPEHMGNTSQTRMWQVMSDIRLNAEVDQERFSTAVPDGFQEVNFGDIELDLTPVALEDVIEMLRLCAQANDQSFPLSLSMNDEPGTPMAIQKQFASTLEKQFNEGTEAEQAAAIESVKQLGSASGRATAFQLSVKPENDWNYFGGAKLNQADRPLLWYSPEAGDNYIVVYADLTVKKMTREELPAKPDGVAEPATPNNVIRVLTPRFELPRSAIREFAKLQEIRDNGKQSEVEYLSLAGMPEFAESQVQFQPGDKIEIRAVDPGWKPNRPADISRLAFLSEFKNLKGLDVGQFYLTQGDLDVIGNCGKLQRLSLSGVRVFESESRHLAGDDLATLSKLNSLELLDLSQSNFAGGLKHLKDLPHLKTLYLSSFEHLNDASVAELSVLPQLETLLLGPVYMDNPKAAQKAVTQKGLASLQNLPRLKKLYVGHHGKWTLPVDRLRELLPDVKVVSPTEAE